MWRTRFGSKREQRLGTETKARWRRLYGSTHPVIERLGHTRWRLVILDVIKVWLDSFMCGCPEVGTETRWRVWLRTVFQRFFLFCDNFTPGKGYSPNTLALKCCHGAGY